MFNSAIFTGLISFHLVYSINTIEELDEAAVFNFVIFSDNKSRSPIEDREMKLAERWISESNTKFLIGVGDHVKKGRNDFEKYLENSSSPTLWRDNFYPNVADGENEYWGRNQGDYGAGAEILNMVNLESNPHLVELRNNKSEYYVKIPIKGFHIHLIQLHYSDSGPGLLEDSKSWMESVLNSIIKGEKDIIIVNGHSTGGNFPENGNLSGAQKDLLFAKADFIFSATNHRYDRKTTSLGNKGALSMNSGAIGEGVTGHEGGFSQIHVLDNPVRLVYQFQVVGGGGNARRQTDRELHGTERSIDGASFVYCIENGNITEGCKWADIQIPLSVKNGNQISTNTLNYLKSKGTIKRLIVGSSKIQNISLSLFNPEGEKQIKIFEGNLKPGKHILEFNSHNLPPGLYFIAGQIGNKKIFKNITIMK